MTQTTSKRMEIFMQKPDARFTVRVPAELLSLFDKVAEQLKTNRSRLIAKVMADEVFNNKE